MAASGFVYTKNDEYQKALENILNPKPFEYDHTQDPQYSAYKKSYLREADRAREDMLAKVSAASGGTPSSFAVTAASQAGDYYTGQLNDVVPTLYQDAYAKYLDNRQLDQSALGALESDRNYENNLYLQLLDKEQAERDQEQQKFNNALALYQALGYATPEVAQILGLNSSTAEGNGGGSSGGRGGGGNPYNNNAYGLSKEEVKAVQQSLGVTADGIWGPATEAAYQAWLATQDQPETPATDPEGSETVESILNPEYTKNKVGDAVSGAFQGQSSTTGAGMNNSQWAETRNNMSNLVSSGNTERAYAYLTSVKDSLSEKQGQALVDMMIQAGMFG